MNIDGMSIQEVVRLISEEIIQEEQEGLKCEAFIGIRVDNKKNCRRTVIGKSSAIMAMILAFLDERADAGEYVMLDAFLFGLLKIFNDKLAEGEKDWQPHLDKMKEFFTKY